MFRAFFYLLMFVMGVHAWAQLNPNIILQAHPVQMTNPLDMGIEAQHIRQVQLQNQQAEFEIQKMKDGQAESEDTSSISSASSYSAKVLVRYPDNTTKVSHFDEADDLNLSNIELGSKSQFHCSIGNSIAGHTRYFELFCSQIAKRVAAIGKTHMFSVRVPCGLDGFPAIATLSQGGPKKLETYIIQVQCVPSV